MAGQNNTTRRIRVEFQPNGYNFRRGCCPADELFPEKLNSWQIGSRSCSKFKRGGFSRSQKTARRLQNETSRDSTKGPGPLVDGLGGRLSCAPPPRGSFERRCFPWKAGESRTVRPWGQQTSSPLSSVSRRCCPDDVACCLAK